MCVCVRSDGRDNNGLWQHATSNSSLYLNSFVNIMCNSISAREKFGPEQWASPLAE